MRYEYKRLPTIDGSDDVYIRLLCLPSGPRSGDIKCSLITTRLSKVPEFEAVSYCWGALLDRDFIYVTGENEHRGSAVGAALQVPRSIIPFLHCARGQHNRKTRILWIDSICINQNDPEERSREVLKMSEIYSKAMSTISWLGPEQDSSDDAISYAIDLAHSLRQHMSKNSETSNSDDQASHFVTTKVTLGDPKLEALFAILDRPYFERAWIVQEVVVSDRVFLVCGDAVIRWEHFLGAFTYFIMATPWIWEFYPTNRLLLLYTLKHTDDDWKDPANSNWLKVLVRLRGLRASDPRDKVYAYYGLQCKDGLTELGIKPDYKNMTVHDLYTTLATNALREGQAAVLHIPRLVRASDTDYESQQLVLVNLPSWVPDWQCTDRTPQPLIYGRKDSLRGSFTGEHRASGESKLDVAFNLLADSSQDPDCYAPQALPTMLRLRGFTVARIVHLTQTWTFPYLRDRRQTLLAQAQNLQRYRQQIATWEAVLRPPAAPAHYSPTGQSQLEAVYDTLLGDAAYYPLKTRQAAYAGFERRQKILRLIPTFQRHISVGVYMLLILVERFLKIFGYENPEIQLRMMMSNVLNRRVARCAVEETRDTEYLALVPGLAAPNDHIMLVQGLRTPLVLRPKGRGMVTNEAKEDKMVDTWEFVGDCYVHGIMNGIVWEKRAYECEDLWIA
ncbi:hypothetical protein HBI56_095490 [Parastagonospora nodorum]|nr:hypothetical protein HBH53_142540 [Parastagonospora nodorum]KAH3966627.1 hypothetical protein HBH51_142810 [Parastagonospora nodorum]KAH3989316.1 hypothetical protein HBH52_017830 [Parastagonospora nodorum]KAH4034345.1 hypothetical protein HBI09_109370 [Parastagonospora nodorum]KAH4057279.1 hypothetical protein HBH49_044250 [Parastagonospora nodorum]